MVTLTDLPGLTQGATGRNIAVGRGYFIAVFTAIVISPAATAAGIGSSPLIAALLVGFNVRGSREKRSRVSQPQPRTQVRILRRVVNTAAYEFVL
jgi:hypothetical protein